MAQSLRFSPSQAVCFKGALHIFKKTPVWDQWPSRHMTIFYGNETLKKEIRTISFLGIIILTLQSIQATPHPFGAVVRRAEASSFKKNKRIMTIISHVQS